MCCFSEAVISAIPTLAGEPEQWAKFMEDEDNVAKYFESLNEPQTA